MSPASPHSTRSPPPNCHEPADRHLAVTMRARGFVAFGLALLLLSCQSAAPIPPGGAAAPRNVPWTDMTEKQRIAFMRGHVLPVMGALFTRHDPDTYPDPTCKLCHGPRAVDGDFRMPNESLPRLSRSLAREQREEPEMTRFMMEMVVPKMSELLEVPPFDPAAGKGFGCGNCHLFK